MEVIDIYTEVSEDEVPVDNYGFKYSSDNEPYIDKSIEHKWKQLMKSSKTFPPKSKKTKQMIRKNGFPPSMRGEAWFFYAGGAEKMKKGVYQKSLSETTNKYKDVIERDLYRTFPDNIYFNSIEKSTLDNKTEVEDPPLIKSLRRVLVAFAHYKPKIGYCQSLNFIAGLLLLFMNEEKSFWMLVILTEKIIPNVHLENLEGVHTDQGVLMLCVKEYIPQLWQVLGKNFDGEALSEDKILARLPPVTLVTSSWFMSLFVGILPVETTLRVWDIIWYEGSKTIFRISLTILKLCLDSTEFKAKQVQQQDIGGTETELIELIQLLQNFPKRIADPNLLIDCCYKKIGGYGFGSLSQDEINKCRDFVSKQRKSLNKKLEQQSLTGTTEEERRKLMNGDLDIHEVYGFHRRPMMSGMVWNKNITNKMKKKFNTPGKNEIA